MTLLQAFQKLIYMKFGNSNWPTIWNIPLNGSPRRLVNTLSELLFMNLKMLATISHICHYFFYINFIHVSVIILNDKYFRKSLIYWIFSINSILGNKTGTELNHNISYLQGEIFSYNEITNNKFSYNFHIVELLRAEFSPNSSFCE